jgi:hypothetical protein
MKSRLLAAVAIGAVFLVAPASAQVKIGILNDQSRVYADSGGKYSLEARQAHGAGFDRFSYHLGIGRWKVRRTHRIDDEITADYDDMIYATTPVEVRRKAFIRK